MIYYSTLTGHTDLINTLVQINNFTLASGSCDQTIKIWNLTSMSLINTLQNNTNCINSLINIYLDSNYLISGSRDGTVQVWSNDYQVIYQKLFNQPVQSITYFSQFRQLAIAGYSNYFEVNEVKNYQVNLKANLNAHSNQVKALVILHNTNIASASLDSTIKIWNSTTFSLVANLTNHTARVSSLAILSNSAFLSGSLDGRIGIWNSTTLQLIKFLIVNAETYSFTILPNTNFVSSTGTKILQWNSTTYTNVLFDIIPNGASALSLATLPNNANIVAACGDNYIRIYDSVLFKLITKFIAHTSAVFTIAVLPNTNLVSGSYDNTIKIWNSTTFSLIKTLISGNLLSGVTSIVVLPNSNFVSTGDSNIKVWDSTLFSALNKITNVGTNTLCLTALSNSRIISGSLDGTVKVWTIEKIKNIYMSITNKYTTEKPITAMGSFDHFVLTGSTDLSITIWDITVLNTATFFKVLTKVHSQKITCFLSINNQFFLSGSADKKIIVWDSNNFNKLYELTLHKGSINSLSYQSNGANLISSSTDTSVIVWNTTNDLSLISELNSHLRQIEDSVQLTSLNYIATCSDDYTIKIWNNQYVNIFNLTEHTNDVYSLIELPNNTMASCSKDRLIIIWNVTNNFSIITKLFGHKRAVISLTLINNQYLASGSCDRTIIIWDLSLKYQIKTILTGHLACVNVLHYVKNDYINYLLSSSLNETEIKIWDAQTFKYLKSINNNLTSSIFAIDSTDTYLAIGQSDSQIKILQNNFRNSYNITNLNGQIAALAILPNKNILSIVGWPSLRFIEINPKTYEQVKYKEMSCFDTQSILFLPNSNFVIGCLDETLKIYNSTSFELINTLNGHTGLVTSLTILPNTNIVSGSGDNTIKIWNSTTYILIDSVTTSSGITVITNLPNSNIVSGGSSSGTIKIWNSTKLKRINILNGHTNTVVALAILPNTNIVSGSRDFTIKIWNSVEYQLITTLVGHSNYVNSLIILPNTNIVSGSYDKTIIIWNSVTFKQITTLTGHTNWVTSLTFLSNTQIFSGSSDYSIKSWTYCELCYLNDLLGHTDSVNDLKFLNNGNLISGSKDKSIILWDINLLKNISINTQHTRSVISLNLLKNGNLISSSEDKTVKIWNTNLFYNFSIIH